MHAINRDPGHIGLIVHVHAPTPQHRWNMNYKCMKIKDIDQYIDRPRISSEKSPSYIVKKN